MKLKNILYLLLIIVSLTSCNSNGSTKSETIFDRVKGSHTFNSFKAISTNHETKAIKVNMKLLVTDTTVTSINCDTQESNAMKIINVIDNHDRKLTLECTDNSCITFVEASNNSFYVNLTGYGDTTKGYVGRLEYVNW